MWVQQGFEDITHLSEGVQDAHSSSTSKRKRDQVEMEKPKVPIDHLLKNMHVQDPKVEFYFPHHTTDDERNFIYRAAFYFAQQPPRSQAPPADTVITALRVSIFTMPNNGTAHHPCSLKLGSAKQIVNFLQFIEQCGVTIWKSCEHAVPRMFIRIEESDYYAYEV